MEEREFKKMQKELRKNVMGIFTSPLMGTIFQAWGPKDSGDLNGLLRQLLGSIDLVQFTPPTEVPNDSLESVSK